jgi:hypothetical protein
VDDDSGRCAHCGKPLPPRAGGGRQRVYCDATCRSAARRARAPQTPRCSVRAGAARCPAPADGRWHDARGTVIAWTCSAHRDLAGDIARAAPGRNPGRWLPAAVAWRPGPPSVTGPAFTLTIRLEDIDPPVWRRVQVPASGTLADLHDVIQVAMGWEGYHLHKFGPVMWSELTGEYEPAAALAGCLRKPGDSIGYLYDFGDNWLHRVTLDKVTARPRGQLPRCTAGARACPPEDSGGPWGYEHALKAVRSRKGWAYRQARETLGPRFDPAAFDRAEINQRLAGLAPDAGRTGSGHATR